MWKRQSLGRAADFARCNRPVAAATALAFAVLAIWAACVLPYATDDSVAEAWLAGTAFALLCIVGVLIALNEWCWNWRGAGVGRDGPSPWRRMLAPERGVHNAGVRPA